MRKLILLIMFGIFLISFVSAETSIDSLGTFEIGKDIELIQMCSNDTSLCDGCNITSIKYPNSSIIASNLVMTTRASDFNYTLLGSFTNNELGVYTVNGYCWTASETKVWSYVFDITLSGKDFTSQQALLYFVVVGILLFIFIFTFMGAVFIPYRNLRSNEETIIGINYLKYAKLFCIYFSYLLFIWIMNLMVGLTNYYLDLGISLSIFAFILRFLSRTLYPLFILTFVFIIYLIVKDKKIIKALERGITLR